MDSYYQAVVFTAISLMVLLRYLFRKRPVDQHRLIYIAVAATTAIALLLPTLLNHLNLAQTALLMAGLAAVAGTFIPVSELLPQSVFPGQDAKNTVSANEVEETSGEALPVQKVRSEVHTHGIEEREEQPDLKVEEQIEGMVEDGVAEQFAKQDEEEAAQALEEAGKESDELVEDEDELVDHEDELREDELVEDELREDEELVDNENELIEDGIMEDEEELVEEDEEELVEEDEEELVEEDEIMEGEHEHVEEAQEEGLVAALAENSLQSSGLVLPQAFSETLSEVMLMNAYLALNEGEEEEAVQAFALVCQRGCLAEQKMNAYFETKALLLEHGRLGELVTLEHELLEAGEPLTDSHIEYIRKHNHYLKRFSSLCHAHGVPLDIPYSAMPDELKDMAKTYQE